MSIDSIQQLRKLINNHYEKLNNILVELQPAFIQVKESNNKKKLVNINMPAGHIPVIADYVELPNIIWSNADLSTLRYISHGAPNATYYDTNLDDVVKFAKSTKDTQANLMFEIKSKEEVIADKNFMDDINNEVSALDEYSRNLNTLPTFCHIKGYVIYHNIRNLLNKNIASSPIIEYLEDFNDKDRFIENGKKYIDNLCLTGG
jgi:hypothetical protein